MGKEYKEEIPPFLNLEKQFIFYASYHNNPVNKFIHLLCIWNIGWSLIYLLQLTPAFFETPTIIQDNLGIYNVKMNVAFFVVSAYVVVYILTDIFAGTIGALMFLGIFLKTSQWVSASATFFGFPGLHFVATVQIIAWILQFIGHGVFERRAPALLDSWDQAFITAPLFVLLEVMFFFGYRKEFHDRCMVQVEKNIALYKKSKKQN